MKGRSDEKQVCMIRKKSNLDAVDAACKATRREHSSSTTCSLSPPPRSSLNAFPCDSILRATSRGLSLIVTLSYWKHVITPSGKRLTRVGMQQKKTNEAQTKNRKLTAAGGPDGRERRVPLTPRKAEYPSERFRWWPMCIAMFSRSLDRCFVGVSTRGEDMARSLYVGMYGYT